MNTERYEDILGSFHSGSLYTKFEFTKNELEKAFVEKYLREYFYVNSTLLHEWCHFIQAISTSIGRRLSDYLIASGTFLSRTFRNYVMEGNLERIRRPLIFNFFYDDRLRESLDETAYLGFIFGALVRGILGHDSSPELMVIFENPLFEPNFFKKPKNAMCPIIEINGSQCILGAWVIFESFASINEKVYIGEIFDKGEYRKILNSIPLYPYYIIELHVRQEISGFNYRFVRALCDLALNPCIECANENNKRDWEDIHPGWRLVRSVEYVRELGIDITLLSEEEILEVIKAIEKHYGWKNPWEEKLAEFASPYFLNDLHMIRERHPSALFLCTENFSLLKSYFPLFIGKPGIPKDILKTSSEFGLKDFNPETNFVAFLQYATITGQFSSILLEPNIRCPLHNLPFPPNHNCVEDCEFEMWFKTLLGISLEDYIRIPIASQEDIVFFENEKRGGT